MTYRMAPADLEREKIRAEEKLKLNREMQAWLRGEQRFTEAQLRALEA